MKRPPQGWPEKSGSEPDFLHHFASRKSGSDPDFSPRSTHLLDAGEQPAARAVSRLHEVPDLGEGLRCRAGRFAHRPGEAHARPVLRALGDDLEQLGVQPFNLSMLAATGVLAQLLEELFGGELTDLVQSP